MAKKYDVIVIGGGAAGCAAAYTAGNLGLKTLLIEKSGVLGGSMTAGLVVPAMKSSENQINTNFYYDLILEMKNLNAQITYQDNPGWFNPELLKIGLDSLLAKANVEVLFDTNIIGVSYIDGHINTINISTELLSTYNYKIYTDNYIAPKILSEHIESRYFVDATGNCEFSKILNCNFLENDEEYQPFSLRFIMSGIDFNRFAKWILEVDSNREITTVEEIEGNIHLSTAYTWDNSQKWALDKLFKDGVRDGVLKPSDINYFQVFSIPGMPDSLAFNCPRIVDIKPDLTVKNISKALIEGRSAIYRLSEFCKKYFKGFENAYISNISDMLGIRSSRRIKGKYVYTADDIINGKTFENCVAISNYPIDVHSDKKDASILRKVSDYQIPLEALISADYDNLFVAGRGISCDYMAQGAIRIQPTCFSMGEGLAKHIYKLINS